VNELTSRERVLRLLQGQPIDRMPVAPRVFQNVVFEFLQRTDVDVVEGTAKYCRHFGFDIIDWSCTPPYEDLNIEGPNWTPVIAQETKGNTRYDIVTVKTPGGELRRVFSTTQTGKWEIETALTEYPIKTERDFELFVEYQPPVPPLDTTILQRAKQIIADDGIVNPSVHGPFNTLVYCYRKLDDLLTDIVVNPEFYQRMIEYFMARVMKYTQQIIDAGVPLIDIGANVANAKLVSPAFWVKHMLPYENRFVDFIQDQGVVGLLHQCGYAANHLDVYPMLHHQGWGYLTPAPHGDTVLEEALRKVPTHWILWGNLDQIDFLRKATPQEVSERVRQVATAVKARGNFILGTSDYLEVNTPSENLRAFVEAGHKYGSYV